MTVCADVLQNDLEVTKKMIEDLDCQNQLDSEGCREIGKRLRDHYEESGQNLSQILELVRLLNGKCPYFYSRLVSEIPELGEVSL